MRWLTVPLCAGFVFGIFAVLAASSVEFTLRDFAAEGGISRFIFVAVPGLFAMMLAMLVYQGPEKTIVSIAESLARGVLVALLTWISLSALATWVWAPSNSLRWFSTVIVVSGVVGGGPMLVAALAAGFVVWWLTKPPNDRGSPRGPDPSLAGPMYSASDAEFGVPPKEQ